jgi:hypothetical protein
VDFRWDSGAFIELDLNHAISKAKDLGPPERVALSSAIEGKLLKSKDNSEIISADELRNIALHSRFQFIDLNGDNTPEVIVQPVGLKAGCGATGNCPFWIFQKTAHGYKSLLDLEEGVQMFRVERTLNNSFHDVAVASHDSASEKTIFVYRWQKDRYRKISCYFASWVATKGGNRRVLKEPSITPCDGIRKLDPPNGAQRQ